MGMASARQASPAATNPGKAMARQTGGALVAGRSRRELAPACFFLPLETYLDEARAARDGHLPQRTGCNDIGKHGIAQRGIDAQITQGSGRRFIRACAKWSPSVCQRCRKAAAKVLLWPSRLLRSRLLEEIIFRHHCIGFHESFGAFWDRSLGPPDMRAGRAAHLAALRAKQGVGYLVIAAAGGANKLHKGNPEQGVYIGA